MFHASRFGYGSRDINDGRERFDRCAARICSTLSTPFCMLRTSARERAEESARAPSLRYPWFTQKRQFPRREPRLVPWTLRLAHSLETARCRGKVRSSLRFDKGRTPIITTGAPRAPAVARSIHPRRPHQRPQSLASRAAGSRITS